jgi:hypothetical protein
MDITSMDYRNETREGNSRGRAVPVDGVKTRCKSANVFSACS